MASGVVVRRPVYFSATFKIPVFEWTSEARSRQFGNAGCLSTVPMRHSFSRTHPRTHEDQACRKAMYSGARRV